MRAFTAAMGGATGTHIALALGWGDVGWNSVTFFVIIYTLSFAAEIFFNNRKT